MGITFAEGIVSKNQRSSYHKLFKRNVLATRYPDNATLRDLGLIDNVNWMLSNLGKTTIDWEGLKATAIQNPTIRIGGPICVGGLITSIALVLDLSTKLATLQPLETPFADLDYCRSIRLIKNKPDRKYYLMISNREVMRVTLPCDARINVRLSANWIFNANTPDPGTSSGYQPREEYYYTTMRITLDDILSELRHQNDVDVERDTRETQLDFVERTKLNMGDLTEQMNGVRMEVSDMREYMQHVPQPEYGRSGIGRHRGRDRHH
ncbi:hypothetical protein KIW84_033840 [Lathyrus oleraceus]|uniref:Arabidopsis retrotransposon Orf1 C-terminal domain-containing protein n=1 Tax=Pisum sativum TaxID=3888 RepID=A0A9D5B3P3_PEA|nr:hypothetical protein KIW84_033840 [Pisum sativum]